MLRPLEALYYPYTICLEPLELKYMLLLYDRVYYLPNDTSLNPGQTTLTKRWSMRDGVLHTLFSGPDQINRAMMYSSESKIWDDEMKKLMDAYDQLEEHEICVPLQDRRFEDASNWHPLVEAVDDDVKDERFVYQTKRAANKKIIFPRPDERAQMKGGGCIIRPFRYKRDLATVELCSERLNTALLFAETHGLVPVSPDPPFVTLLNVKLRRAIKRHADELHAEYDKKRASRFSTLSWQLLTEVATPEALAQRSFIEVLKYRSECADAASRFREYVFSLEASLSEDPWSEKAKAEVDRVVRAIVVPELQRVREAKANIWRKLFDDTLTSVFSPTSVAAAATIVPMAMHYVPGMTYLQLLSYSTAGLLAETLPGLVGARRQEIEYRKNALFFLLNLR
jgi:hypothetical protein